MLSVTRGPLTSPAIRTVTLASSQASLPFHHAAPSSPLSRPSPSQPPQINFPGSPGASREPAQHIPGSPTFGGYFNLGSLSPSLSKISASEPPQFLAPPRPAVTIVSAPRSETQLASSRVAGTDLKFEHLKVTSPKATKSIASASDKSTEAPARRRPSFTLAIPRPNMARDDSFEAVALAGFVFTPSTPGELKWRDSFDSVVTLKPTKGRVSTPYPKSEGGQWLEDDNEVVRESNNMQTRLARLFER